MQEQFDSVVHNDHVEGEAEHVFWLDDAEKWRADHRRLLDMLMQVQAAILEEDAALNAHIRDIHLHEKARLRHELLEAGAGSPNLQAQTALEDMHRRLEIKHARARSAHERMSEHHQRLVDLVERLLAATREPM